MRVIGSTGSGWPGLRLLLARIPDRGDGIVIIALADATERRSLLADAPLDTVTGIGVPHAGGMTVTPGQRRQGR